MSVVGVLISLLLIAFTGFWYYLSNKNKDFYKTIPGPPPLPIFGNALEVQNTLDLLPAFLKYTKQYGSIYKLHVGPIWKNLIISDYKILEAILSSSKILSKSREYKFLDRWLGTGLLTSTDDKWRKHRRILTPAFHFQILEQFLCVFHSASGVLVEKLKKQVGKDSVDIYPFVTLCALDIISESAMNVKLNAQECDTSPYVQSVKQMCKIIIERTFTLLQMFNSTYHLTRNYYIEKQALKILHSHTNEVIVNRREAFMKKKNNENHDELLGKKRMAFLDILLQATKDGRPLTNEEIREEVDTFMFEGHDTTASAMSFALYCLANHPEVQEKVYKEQRAIFGDQNDPVPTNTDLQDMKYLEQVIKETLRLYPSVPIYGRETTQPVELNGKIFPKGLSLTIFTYGIHRNPEYYKNPEEFDPSRFEDVDGKLPYAFIPFSAGPRNCIGQKFAMLEMKSTISKVVRNFVLKSSIPYHNLQLVAETVLKSNNGIKIKLELRQ